MSHQISFVYFISHLQTKRTYLRVYVVWEFINLCYYAKRKLISEFSLTIEYLPHLGHVYEAGYLLSCVHSYYLNLFWLISTQILSYFCLKCTRQVLQIKNISDHQKYSVYPISMSQSKIRIPRLKKTHLF